METPFGSRSNIRQSQYSCNGDRRRRRGTATVLLCGLLTWVSTTLLRAFVNAGFAVGHAVNWHLAPSWNMPYLRRLIDGPQLPKIRLCAHFSDDKFQNANISSNAKRAMCEGFGYEFMTAVQARTLEPITQGADLLVSAKTGAGKTLSFLLPAIERVLSQIASNREAGTVDILVLSPVRELSLQIHKEAEALANFYGNLRAVCVVGGVSPEHDREALSTSDASGTILVATPGRLLDHLDNTPGFAKRLEQLQVLVLDEVDQLAGEYFTSAIMRVLKVLPPPAERQTLFYSATMSDAVHELAAVALKQDHMFVETTEAGDDFVPEQIQQRYKFVAVDGMNDALWEALQHAKARDGQECKVVVILMTARIAAYYGDLFRQTSLASEVFEIHARKPQDLRTAESERFRECRDGILFTSDVSSRGLDYPGVTEVIQVGAPDSREDYIHRLGRTGRAGSDGRGLLLLRDFEEHFLLTVEDLQLQPESSVSSDVVDFAPAPDFSQIRVGKDVKAEAYYSWLNHVLRNSVNVSKLKAVQEAKRFADSIGALDEDGLPPRITERNAIKMGLGDIDDPALHVVAQPKGPEVTQSYQVVATADMVNVLWRVVKTSRSAADSKIKAVVFCIAPLVASYFSEAFRRGMLGVDVFEIHSKVSKGNRKKELKRFQAAPSGILFSSDVAAQNLVGPGVTDVIMVGAPETPLKYEQQVKVVSTASGKSYLLLHEFERDFLAAVQDAPLVMGIADSEGTATGAMPLGLREDVDEKLRAKAYYAWLEHYCAERAVGYLTKLETVQEASLFAESIGAVGPGGLPPPIGEKNVKRLGLEGIAGSALNVVADS